MVARLDIGHRLVHEALTGHVDDDRSRRVAFGQREPGCTDQGHRRAPPGVLHHIQCGTQLFGRQDSVAGIGHRSDRPLGGDRGALVLDPHLLVVFEPAAAQDHAAPRPDELRVRCFGPLGVAYQNAGDDTVFDVQVGHCGVQQHRHSRVTQPDAQRGDEGTAHPDEVLARGLGPHRAGAHLETAQHAAGVALELVQPDIVLLHHHHVEWHLAVRGFEALEVRAELLGVERLGFDRPPGGLASRSFGVVVGVVGNPAQLQRGVPQDERQHLRPALEVGVDLVGRHHVSDDRVQVGAGRLGGVLDAIALQDLVVGDPHAAA